MSQIVTDPPPPGPLLYNLTFVRNQFQHPLHQTLPWRHLPGSYQSYLGAPSSHPHAGSVQGTTVLQRFLADTSSYPSTHKYFMLSRTKIAYGAAYNPDHIQKNCTNISSWLIFWQTSEGAEGETLDFLSCHTARQNHFFTATKPKLRLQNQNSWRE